MGVDMEFVTLNNGGYRKNLTKKYYCKDGKFFPSVL